MSENAGIKKSSWDIILDFFDDKLMLGDNDTNKGFYYTTIDTLDKILCSGALYSTNYRYLNDPGEWQYGYNRMMEVCQVIAAQYDNDSSTKDFVDYMRKYIFKAQHYLNDYPVYSSSVFRGNYSEIFTISFTEEEDLISQWERYAKESGVVLEMDFTPFRKEQICLYQETVNKSKIPIGIIPQRVAYKDEEIKMLSDRSMRTLLEKFTKKIFSEDRLIPYFHMLIRYIASYIKNAAYEQEKEIRISCYPLINEATSEKEIDSSDIVYTIQEGVMIPHIPIYCGEKRDDGISVCGFPIRSIRVGPGYNQDSVFHGLIHRMECGEIKIHLLSAAEQTYVKNRYILEGIAKHMQIEIVKAKSNRTMLRKIVDKLGEKADLEELKDSLNDIYANSKKADLGDASERLQELKQRFYEQIFEEYEKEQFCTSDGILIKKSKIPYLFSKR